MQQEIKSTLWEKALTVAVTIIIAGGTYFVSMTNSRLAAIEARQQGNAERMSVVEAAIVSLKESITLHRDDVRAMNARFDKLLERLEK